MKKTKKEKSKREDNLPCKGKLLSSISSRALCAQSEKIFDGNPTLCGGFPLTYCFYFYNLFYFIGFIGKEVIE